MNKAKLYSPDSCQPGRQQRSRKVKGTTLPKRQRNSNVFSHFLLHSGLGAKLTSKEAERPAPPAIVQRFVKRLIFQFQRR